MNDLEVSPVQYVSALCPFRIIDRVPTRSWTDAGGARVQYNFTGDAISILGTVAPNHANYSVTIDDQTQTFDGTAGHGVTALRAKVISVQFSHKCISSYECDV